MGKRNKVISDHSSPLPTGPSWSPNMRLIFKRKGRGMRNPAVKSLSWRQFLLG